jgi:hypothetical protein
MHTSTHPGPSLIVVRESWRDTFPFVFDEPLLVLFEFDCAIFRVDVHGLAFADFAFENFEAEWV